MRLTKITTVAAILALTPIAVVRAAETGDTWLTTKAKIAVLGAVGTSATQVHVVTNDGLVTLHGTVTSASDKTDAESAVKKLDGVKKVRNLLEVVASKKQDTVAASDSDVGDKVKNVLQADAVLKSETGIKVDSVNAGTVVLSGNASTLSNHLRAIEDVRKVPGVKRVASTIESPDSKAVRQISMHDTARAVKADAKEKTGGLKQSVSDAYITTKTKARLLADSKTPGTAINVDTQDGVVTLSGTVNDTVAKRAAETKAAKVDGVKSVRNDLEVKTD